MRPNLASVSAAALIIGALAAAPVLSQDAPVPGTVMVSGHGEVSAAPDTAYVTSGVMTQGATAREALDANTAAMNELIATLKASGIEARDIQTSGFTVSPNYVYTEERDANGYTLPPKINDYIVNNSVTIRVRALDTLGAVLDKAVTVGANTINGISFALADPSKQLDEARRLAFAEAQSKAELYAELAGLPLGTIVNISEQPAYGQPQPYLMSAEMYDRAAAAPVPVEAGELSYAMDVTVSWTLDAGAE